MLPHEGQRSGSAAAAEGVITADMVAQLAYCPRRFHLAYVEGRWADNAETDGGRFEHRRVDEADQLLPAAELTTERRTHRSVPLQDDELAIAAKLDAVECWRGASGVPCAYPVETKRGSAPATPEGTWEPERVQLMLQALLLRRRGFDVTAGAIFYAESSKRVEVALDEALAARTLELAAAARLALRCQDFPPPLADSPKCPRCSLVAICLPDETALLAGAGQYAEPQEVRRLFPARDDGLPLYVQEQGAFVGKHGEVLTVHRGEARLAEARLKDVSHLVLCGSIGVSPAAVHLLCEAGRPIVHLTSGHWFCGITQGVGLRNAYDRAAQFKAAADDSCRLRLAKAFVRAKGANQRTLLRRNAAPEPGAALDAMAVLVDRVDAAEAPADLLGIEGSIAAQYFGTFGAMLRPKEDADGGDWPVFSFEHRNRRPPRDPINAMLSFGYALLAKECTIALLAAGLDPYWGFYHQPRHGRPALALDLMEEFRPLVVDSAIITAVNTGMVAPSGFVRAGPSCAMKDVARKAFIRAYEGRLDQLATHPRFDYRCSWRRIIALQAQVLARVLRGDIADYEGITTR